MPIFETPAAISVTADLGVVGELLITASDRADTVVEVRPSNAADESDVQAAQQVQVDFADGALRIRGPKARAFDFSRRTRSVDLSIELPSGSRVSAETQIGDVRSVGRLGDCRFKTSAGRAALDRTGALYLHSGAGQLTVEGAAGDAEIYTGTGEIRVGEIGGAAGVKSANGDITIGSVGGDARLRSSNGEITVGRAGAGVDAKSANGAIRLGEVARGAAKLATAAGDIEIGIAEGSAAWLDVNTGFGKVRNELTGTTRPAGAVETVEVRGHTPYGDISIHRS